MLRSYEAIYEDGQVKWLDERPPIESARIIVTVLKTGKPQMAMHRSVSTSIADKERTLGNPVVLENEVSAEQERTQSEDNEPLLEDLGGSEPQAQDISRRRYSY